MISAVFCSMIILSRQNSKVRRQPYATLLGAPISKASRYFSDLKEIQTGAGGLNSSNVLVAIIDSVHCTHSQWSRNAMGSRPIAFHRVRLAQNTLSEAWTPHWNSEIPKIVP